MSTSISPEIIIRQNKDGTVLHVIVRIEEFFGGKDMRKE